MGPSCPQVQNGPHHLFPKIYPSLITLQSSLVPKLETPASFWNPPCPSAFPSPADSAPIYLSNHSFSPYLPPCAQLRPLLRAFEHKPPIHPHIIHLTHTPATQTLPVPGLSTLPCTPVSPTLVCTCCRSSSRTSLSAALVSCSWCSICGPRSAPVPTGGACGAWRPGTDSLTLPP